MIRKSLLALALMAVVPLAGCGDNKVDTEALKSAPIAKIAPPAGSKWSETVVQTKEGGYLMGNPDAPIKVVEYFALSCSHCRDFERTAFDELIGDFVESGRVNLELRNFLLGPPDVPFTILTRCGATESYFPLTRQFYENLEADMAPLQQLDQAQYEAAMQLPEKERFLRIAQLFQVYDFFKARGISEDQANQCLTNPENLKQLVDMNKYATDELKVNQTPTIFINGTASDIALWPPLKTRLMEMGAR
ncbi:MAG: thioredoxin domain-containing protein [Parasphingorhabdus sp.]|nr:thioredoxin domain-containing protein [Parasphingorhabdus sp.]